ncbi:hypothetical protein [Streptomyces sp. DH8]|uniref:hypothetical protein n=1 Tax=Streptomyces sp. DH8 TaxID=2857008 RepID=UPI0035B4E68F
MRLQGIQLAGPALLVNIQNTELTLRVGAEKNHGTAVPLVRVNLLDGTTVLVLGLEAVEPHAKSVLFVDVNDELVHENPRVVHVRLETAEEIVVGGDLFRPLLDDAPIPRGQQQNFFYDRRLRLRVIRRKPVDLRLQRSNKI